MDSVKKWVFEGPRDAELNEREKESRDEIFRSMSRILLDIDTLYIQNRILH